MAMHCLARKWDMDPGGKLCLRFSFWFMHCVFLRRVLCSRAQYESTTEMHPVVKGVSMKDLTENKQGIKNVSLLVMQINYMKVDS